METRKLVEELNYLFSREKLPVDKLPEFMNIAGEALRVYRAQPDCDEALVVAAEGALNLAKVRGLTTQDRKYISKVVARYAKSLGD